MALYKYGPFPRLFKNAGAGAPWVRHFSGLLKNRPDLLAKLGPVGQSVDTHNLVGNEIGGRHLLHALSRKGVTERVGGYSRGWLAETPKSFKDVAFGNPTTAALKKLMRGEYSPAPFQRSFSEQGAGRPFNYGHLPNQYGGQAYLDSERIKGVRDVLAVLRGREQPFGPGGGDRLGHNLTSFVGR